MKIEHLKVGNIPAILWGNQTNKLFIAVHGNMSNKADAVITIFAEEAIKSGYQVLSFDLPQHGDRKEDTTLCKVQQCVQELHLVMEYATSISDAISVFACSIGAYFSLLAYKDDKLQQSLFLSPVVDMAAILMNLMTWFEITENQLMQENKIVTPMGEILYWDYYCYVKENPIINWPVTTSILCGSEDNVSDPNIITSFSTRFNCDLEVLSHGEHHFHTAKQLSALQFWVREKLSFN